MADITKEAVQEKLNKGEALSKEETQFVMSSPPDGTEAVETDEELGFGPDGEEIEVENKEKEKSKTTPEGDKEKAETDKAAKEKSEEKKPEDTETGKEKPAEKKEEKKPDEETFHAKIERELELPDNQVKLEGFSEREKGLYWELRKERKARQKAEEDRDAEKFERIKKDRAAQEEAKRKPEEEKPDEDDESFITKGDLKKQQADREKKDAEARAVQARAVIIKTSDIAAHGIIESRRAKGEDIPDYDKVMELGPTIIVGNEAYDKKIAIALAEGKNAALVVYDLIRKDPRFKSLYNPEALEKKPEEKKEEKPAEKVEKPEDKGKENLKKIDENSKKPKTSGAEGGGDAGGYGDYTIEQLAKMSNSEFRKVPKAIREKFLQEAG